MNSDEAWFNGQRIGPPTGKLRELLATQTIDGETRLAQGNGRLETVRQYGNRHTSLHRMPPVMTADNHLRYG